MPDLVRKLLVYASINGLVVQAHGPVDHHKAIHLDYKSRQIQGYTVEQASQDEKSPHLEAHGLIGMNRPFV